MRARFKKSHKKHGRKTEKDCTLKDRVDAFHVSCQHTNKKQANKQTPQKTRFYIRVSQDCLTEENTKQHSENHEGDLVPCIA